MKRCLLLAILLTSVSHAHAFSGPTPSFSDLVSAADLIVAGTVAEVRGVWAKDRSAIFSFVTIENLEVIEGAYPAPTLVLRQDGGEVQRFLGKTKERVSGTPEFETGQRVLLFVAGNGTAFCPLVGWSSGALRLSRDASGKERVLSWERGLELAGVEDDRLLFKIPLGPRPQVTESNPAGRELRLKLEAERLARRERVLKLDLTYDDFKKLIRERAKVLRESGKKTLAKAESVDPRAELPSRRLEAVRPKTSRRSGDKP